jgi:hypothetical protein
MEKACAKTALEILPLNEKIKIRKEIISDLLETDLSEETRTGDMSQVFLYNAETKLS